MYIFLVTTYLFKFNNYLFKCKQLLLNYLQIRLHRHFNYPTHVLVIPGMIWLPYNNMLVIGIHATLERVTSYRYKPGAGYHAIPIRLSAQDMGSLDEYIATLLNSQ